MTSHPLKQVIEAADRAIVAEDFDALMDFYADDAILVANRDCTRQAKSKSGRRSSGLPNTSTTAS